MNEQRVPSAEPHDWIVRVKGNPAELGRVHARTWMTARAVAVRELARKLGRAVVLSEVELEAAERKARS